MVFQAKNNVSDVESQYIKFNSKSKGFDMEKSDIHNNESDSKTEDEYFDQSEEIDESFSHQDPKISSSFVLKQDNLGEKNLWKVWGVSIKRIQQQKKKQQKKLKEAT